MSNFILNKKFEWLPKSCEFKLYCSKKGKKFSKVGEKKYDVTAHIGQVDSAPVELQISKDISLSFKINILPACPKLHRNLFEAANEADKK